MKPPALSILNMDEFGRSTFGPVDISTERRVMQENSRLSLCCRPVS
jgi:hypothetical protein